MLASEAESPVLERSNEFISSIFYHFKSEDQPRLRGAEQTPLERCQACTGGEVSEWPLLDIFYHRGASRLHDNTSFKYKFWSMEYSKVMKMSET